MKVAIMGAGAVGCFYGGMLARAGHDVTLIGRQHHVSAIRQHGLRLETQHFDETVAVTTNANPDGAAGAELVLFCVKSTDTDAAASALRPYLSEKAIVLTLQNGIDNAERVRRVVAQEVAAAVVYVACEMAAPGHVRHHGRGELIIEPSGAGERIAELLTHAGVPTQVSGNVRAALWEKLILNCAYNAVSALLQLPFGELRRLGGDNVEIVMRNIVAECIEVARADGVAISDDVITAVQTIMATIPAGQYSSTAQDLSRNRPSEIDHLNGFIVRRGSALGVSTPVNHLLLMLVKILEGKQAERNH